MSEYTLSQVSPTDKTTLAEIDALLQQRQIPLAVACGDAVFQLGQQLGGVVENISLSVHLAVIAVPDEAALPHGEGGLVHQRPAQQLPSRRAKRS